MTQKVILPLKFYKEGTGCGFTYDPELKDELRTFLNNLYGLKYIESWGYIHLHESAFLTPLGENNQPTNGPWDNLLLEWTC